MTGVLGMKGGTFAGAFGGNVRFSKGSTRHRGPAAQEPKQGKNVAENVHLLFKMTTV
jgi:hypothetical protein